MGRFMLFITYAGIMHLFLQLEVGKSLGSFALIMLVPMFVKTSILLFYVAKIKKLNFYICICFVRSTKDVILLILCRDGHMGWMEHFSRPLE